MSVLTAVDNDSGCVTISGPMDEVLAKIKDKWCGALIEGVYFDHERKLEPGHISIDLWNSFDESTDSPSTYE